MALLQILLHEACVPLHVLRMADTNPPGELAAQAACAIASASNALKKYFYLKDCFKESFVKKIDINNL